jgi:alkylation response protein AidB-like acyl-CoA dehydrogenase
LIVTSVWYSHPVTVGRNNHAPYQAPIEDYRFLLNEVLGFDEAMVELGLDVDATLAEAVLEEAGRYCAERLARSTARAMSMAAGSRMARSPPPGFAAAWRDFTEAGWTSLTADPAYGGQGLPFILQLWQDEMLSATNMAFGLFPGLTRGAAEAIAAHASDDLNHLSAAPHQWRMDRRHGADRKRRRHRSGPAADQGRAAGR